MSNVAIDLTKTVKEIITTMKTAIDNLNTNVDSLKSEVLLAAHPVGSYYISDNATDPASLFGGTWQMLDPGLTLISQGKGTDKFGSFEFVAGQTYGERMHQLTVDELPTIRQQVQYTGGAPLCISEIQGNIKTLSLTNWRYVNTDGSTGIYTNPIGGNQPHSNLTPAKACYIWIRMT